MTGVPKVRPGDPQGSLGVFQRVLCEMRNISISVLSVLVKYEHLKKRSQI